MEPSKIILNARNLAESFNLWLQDRVKPLAEARFPADFASWCKEVETIRTMVDKPGHLQIALVGTTGAGKSTFLNAVLGEEVLPVGVMHPVQRLSRLLLTPRNLIIR